jgi:hypothetical protein
LLTDHYVTETCAFAPAATFYYSQSFLTADAIITNCF